MSRWIVEIEVDEDKLRLQDNQMTDPESTPITIEDLLWQETGWLSASGIVATEIKEQQI